MKFLLVFLLACSAALAQAATPAEMQAAYRKEAGAAFQPSAQRGRDFYQRRFGVSEKLASCATCHSDNPAQAGRHVVTDKVIEPMAPSANPARFTDPAKTEKWFRRNCKEVVGRECTAGEKADFVAYLAGGR